MKNAKLEANRAVTLAKERLVRFRTGAGEEVRSALLRITRFLAVFEIYDQDCDLRLSEALDDFQILLDDQAIYSGRATIVSMVHTGSSIVCEAALDEVFLDRTALATVSEPDRLRDDFEEFIHDWSQTCRILPEFKVVVADMQTFFHDLRFWMEQTDLGLRSDSSPDRVRKERQILELLQHSALSVMRPLLEMFENTANRVSPALVPAHRDYMKRQLHPLVLCSPFLHRTFRKPLGYAGDYEMVNMMIRDPFEGDSLFAKMVNRIFLDTPPVVAHQNRIVYLKDHILSETQRAVVKGRSLEIYNLGCGPAREIQNFLARESLSDHVEFTLVDFNEQTIADTRKVMEEFKTRHQRRTGFTFIKKSVIQVLKEAERRSGPARQFPMIYCAGLFDYLEDRVCKSLMNSFYNMLLPGGLLLATNVNRSNPSRNWMEYMLDWHLIYRTPADFARLAPDLAPPENCGVRAIENGVNIALEVRKPGDGR